MVEEISHQPKKVMHTQDLYTSASHIRLVVGYGAVRPTGWSWLLSHSNHIYTLPLCSYIHLLSTVRL